MLKSLLICLLFNLAMGFRALVICGPSGVGKGTIIGSLIKRFNDKVALSVSHTTRKPRHGESNGVHYHFVTEDVMLEGIKDNLFLEHAKVHNHLYGTSRTSIDNIVESKRIPILDVDTLGVLSIKKKKFPANYVFIKPPSIEILENRLRNRGTESEPQLLLRLENAKREMAYGTEENFDLVLENDKLDDTVKNLHKVMSSWYPQIEKQK